MNLHFSLPANLLLAGEYAILEEGGLGLGLAVDFRLQGRIEPTDHWELQGLWPGGGLTWQPGQEAVELLPKVFVWMEREAAALRGLTPHRILLDSSAFFLPDGRKLGFGSSAAAAAGLVAALLALQHPGLVNTPEAWAAAAQPLAVQAHREAQGGKGSGYDVTVSLFGGLGLFQGGVRPLWTPLPPDFSLPALWTFPGPEAVKTVSSITAYRTWQAKALGDHSDWLDRSRAAVQSWARAFSEQGWTRALVYLRELRQLGLEVGQAIGVPAELPAPPFGPGWFSKALGAGNETGLLAGPDLAAALPPGSSGFQPLLPSYRGLSRESV